jgi:hypothetical protein
MQANLCSVWRTAMGTQTMFTNLDFTRMGEHGRPGPGKMVHFPAGVYPVKNPFRGTKNNPSPDKVFPIYKTDGFAIGQAPISFGRFGRVIGGEVPVDLPESRVISAAPYLGTDFTSADEYADHVGARLPSWQELSLAMNPPMDLKHFYDTACRVGMPIDSGYLKNNFYRFYIAKEDDITFVKVDRAMKLISQGKQVFAFRKPVGNESIFNIDRRDVGHLMRKAGAEFDMILRRYEEMGAMSLIANTAGVQFLMTDTGSALVEWTRSVEDHNTGRNLRKVPRFLVRGGQFYSGTSWELQLDGLLGPIYADQVNIKVGTELADVKSILELAIKEKNPLLTGPNGWVAFSKTRFASRDGRKAYVVAKAALGPDFPDLGWEHISRLNITEEEVEAQRQKGVHVAEYTGFRLALSQPEVEANKTRQEADKAAKQRRYANPHISSGVRI